MRTMKKILALSLVMAMAFSMMAGAAFNDQASINADLVEDINLFIALGVFSEQGTGNGDFEPTKVLTRAEMAKLIYVLKNKGLDNGGAGWTGLNTFSDIPAGHWAEGYIEWAAATGVMVGGGDGMFRPNDPITGIQLAKMLLVMIGYKPDMQGYTGERWSQNILKDAENAGLFAEFGMSATAPVTREWAARMMKNAIYATKVRYVSGQLEEIYSTAGDVTTAATFAGQDLGLVKVVGTLIGVPKMTLTAPSTFGDISEPNTDVNTKYGTIINNNSPSGVNFTYNVNANLLGQEVQVLYKETSGSEVKNGLDKGDKVYGVSTTGKSKVYDVAAKDVTIGRNNTAANALTDVTIKFAGYNNGSAKKIGTMTNAATGNDLVGVPMKDSELTMFIDNVNSPVTTVSSNKFTAPATNKETFTHFLSNIMGNTNVRFIDTDNNGVLDYAFTTQPAYYVVGEYNANRNQMTVDTSKTVIKNDVETLVGSTTTKLPVALPAGTAQTNKDNFAKYNFIDTPAKGDVIAVVPNYTSGKLIYDVTKVSTISGSVSRYNNGTITVNGSTYTKGANALSSKYPAGTSTTSETFWVIGSYVVYSESVVSSNYPSNIAMVITSGEVGASGVSGGYAEVKMLLADGTVAVYKYSVPDDAKNAIPRSDVYTDRSAQKFGTTGVVVQCIQNGNGSVYFKDLAAANVSDGTVGTAAGSVTLKPTQKTMNVDGVNYILNDASVIFVGYETKYGDNHSEGDHGSCTKSYKVMKVNEIKGDMTGNSGANFAYITSTAGAQVVQYAAVVSTSEMPASSATSQYFYATTRAYSEIVDGKTLFFVDGVMNNKSGPEAENIVKMQIAEPDNIEAFRNNVYKVGSTAANGNVNLIAVAYGTENWTNGAALMVDSNTVVIKDAAGNVGTYAINADTKFIYVDKTIGASKGGNNWLTSGTGVYLSESNKNNVAFTFKTESGVNILTTIVVEVNGDTVSAVQ